MESGGTDGAHELQSQGSDLRLSPIRDRTRVDTTAARCSGVNAGDRGDATQTNTYVVSPCVTSHDELRYGGPIKPKRVMQHGLHHSLLLDRHAFLLFTDVAVPGQHSQRE